MEFDLAAYGPAVAGVLRDARPNPLGPGTPTASLRPTLATLSPEAIVAPHAVRDRQMAECCLAGLWLAHDFLDESHEISQQIETPSGSYWHGVMHRREPDYGNSKYWFRRVGRHPIFALLAAAAHDAAGDAAIPQAGRALVAKPEWDPFGFVDLCQQALDDKSLQAWCVQVQQREWELLFDFCYARAIGR